MPAKFKLTAETKSWMGRTLYRVDAVISFGSIEQGEQGGWVEKKENLADEGNAWVSGNAWVYGNARVYGDARVYGNARVYGDARVSPVVLTGFPHIVTICDDRIKVGCECHDLPKWEADGAAIIKAGGYTPEEAEEWRDIIVALGRAHFKRVMQ